ncbi:hypothetical protein [Geminicoccus flavidas]|uniref:hypothetical protein n=1 Tax=Geminicoccus flavidas TaxID=2506407 RepID=UPI001358F990|nr:hypothetical protein [Geminicoccus flavidas]
MYTIISSLICTCITGLLVLQHPELLHWFVVPLTMCGILIGRDLVRWAYGQMDPFDPAALAGLLFFNGFYIAPMMQIAWNFFPGLPSLDWPHWFGIWGIISFFGLAVYVFVRDTKYLPIKGRSVYVWAIDNTALTITAVIFLTISAASVVLVFARFGGLSGIAAAYDMRAEMGRNSYDPFEGLGVILLFANAFTVLFPICLLLFLRKYKAIRSNGFFILYCMVTITVAAVVAGAFGSRARVIYPIFICVATYHFMVRPVARKWLLIGASCVMLLMNVYYWYKQGGLAGLNAIFDESAQQEILARKHVDDEIRFTMTRDFSRADMQAFLISKELGGDLEHAWGRTYMAAVLAVIPRSVFPARPPTAAKEKTEALYGAGSYSEERMTNVLVGLLGEGILNFGLALAPLLYAGVGYVARFVRMLQWRLMPGDLRRLLIAPACILPTTFTFADSNVIATFIMTYFLFPTLLVVFGRRRMKLSPRQVPVGRLHQASAP